jgi:hypothetical protein
VIIQTHLDIKLRNGVVFVTGEKGNPCQPVIVAGDVREVSRHALKLRLAIALEERGIVLDHIGKTRVAHLNIDIVENAINALFDDRFMEP